MRLDRRSGSLKTHHSGVQAFQSCQARYTVKLVRVAPKNRNIPHCAGEAQTAKSSNGVAGWNAGTGLTGRTMEARQK